MPMKTKRDKKALGEAVRRGQMRNKLRGLPYGPGRRNVMGGPKLCPFDEQFLKLYEKGYSERQIGAKLKIGRGTVHRTKKLLGLIP